MITSQRAADHIELIKDLDSLIEEHKQTRAELVAELVEYTSAQTGKHTLPTGESFTVRAINTYDEATMTAALKPGQVQRCSKLRLDKAVVKALYPAVYAAAKQSKGHTVIV